MVFRGGYVGQVLRIDLTKKKIKKVRLSKGLVSNYIGGRGFTSKVQYDEVSSYVDALSPDNRLIFATCPLNGTLAPAAARFTIGGKSPLTGILGDANAGGHWASELKFAGYDAVIVQGKSENPVYIWINDENAEIRNANHLWGKSTRESESIIKGEAGDEKIRFASIGQAGENLVRFACVVASGGTAARTGMGCVMGSKKLKTIAVRGTNEVKVADEKRFREAVNKIIDSIRVDPLSSKAASKLGSSMWVDIANTGGFFPTRNWQTGIFEGAEEISGEALRKQYFVKSVGCFGCPIQCKHYAAVEDGPYAGTHLEGLEFAAPLFSLGSLCGNGDLASIIRAGELCQLYGLDGGSTGAVIAFMMECYEKGLITSKDMEGLDLRWGNSTAIIELIERIAFRSGLGNILADGARTAAEKIGKGAEKYALHVKGLELITGWDLRVFKVFGVAHAVASRGGDHMRYVCTFPSEFALLPLGLEKVAIEMKRAEERSTVMDMLGACKFGYLLWVSSPEILKVRLENLVEMYSASAGIEVSWKDLMRKGETLLNLERAFNVTESLTREDDTLPERFLKEPMPSGPYEGHVNDVFEPLLNEYYKVRGWNVETGIPTRGKLMELGLSYVANKLESQEKIKSDRDPDAEG